MNRLSSERFRNINWTGVRSVFGKSSPFSSTGSQLRRMFDKKKRERENLLLTDSLAPGHHLTISPGPWSYLNTFCSLDIFPCSYIRTIGSLHVILQGDQLYITVLFWYLVKCDLSYTSVTFNKVLEQHGHVYLVSSLDD